MWWLLLLPFSAFAQNELDLEAIKKLENSLPPEYAERGEDPVTRKPIRHRPPHRRTTLEQIMQSGTEYGHVKAGRALIRLSDNKAVELTESFYGKFFRLEDEHNFKYIQSNDGSCVYKIKSSHFTSIQPELALYEPPLRYTPAPPNIIRAEYDKRLKINPELSFFVGYVQGRYMEDLFNDKAAASGVSTQYGVHFATGWELPVKVGLVLHYEKATYDLSGGGKLEYSSPSFGPQFKTKDFQLNDIPLRLQIQFRVSPWARAHGETENGGQTFKFNSADFLASLEHPLKNSLGEFVLGLYMQSQWLNMKDQPELIDVKASSETNQSFGITLSQVFE